MGVKDFTTANDVPAVELFATEESRWAALAARDRAADGLFYYSVETTGVYCRPSCAARLPRRQNVRFYESCRAAEAAGFRACKRCRPNDKALEDQHRETIEKACRAMEQADELPKLEELAAAAGLSRFYFQRKFKAVTGVTPREYFHAHRVKKVREGLQRSATVTDAIYDAGFNSNGRFYAESSQMLGMTPKRFRAGGDGTSIRFAVGECFLGSLLVAATEKGICSILLGDDPQKLLEDLQDRFPRAKLVGGDQQFEQWMAQIVGFIEAPKQSLGLPLDVRGTAFQQRVWQALRDIPVGSTVSYQKIAGEIGAPKAVRAVAQACASNQIAVAIPCHRVVRTDGALSGYRWGVERKRALLQREAAS